MIGCTCACGPIMAAEESFEKAKRLLLGAVDTVLHAATHLHANDTGAGDGPSRSSTPRPSTHRPSLVPSLLTRRAPLSIAAAQKREPGTLCTRMREFNN